MKTFKCYYRIGGKWKYSYATGHTANAAKKIIANMYYIDVGDVVVA